MANVTTLFAPPLRLIETKQLDFLIRFCMTLSPKKEEAQSAINIITCCDLTENQEWWLVGVIKQYHLTRSNTMTSEEKLAHLLQLRDGYLYARQGTWMSSALVKLLENWVDQNSPELDNALATYSTVSNSR